MDSRVLRQRAFWKLDRLIAGIFRSADRMPGDLQLLRSARGGVCWKRTGFQSPRPWSITSSRYRIPDYVQYRYRKVWYFRWMPGFLFRALERAGLALCLTGRPAPSR